MNFDLVYGFILNCGRLFFTAWSVVLVSAALKVFQGDLR
jgi:hypothetical protein